MWDPYAEFSTKKLPNGLEIHAAQWPGRTFEAVGILIHSGARHDPVGLEGLAHFVEHMVSENAPISREKIVDEVRDCGGSVNLGATGYGFTSYGLFLPSDRVVLERAFSVFGQMLMASVLELKLERERQVILQEFHRSQSLSKLFDYQVRERRALYGGLWIERFVRPLGAPESIQRITAGDLQEFFDRHYVPANISIVGVGGLSLDELAEIISTSPFAAEKDGIRQNLPEPVSDFLAMPENGCIIDSIDIMTDAPSAGTYRRVYRVGGDVNHMALEAVACILEKILQEDIRQKRAWTYDVHIETQRYGECFELRVHCPALAVEGLDQIDDIVEVCVDSLGQCEELLDQFKRHRCAKAGMIDIRANGLLDGAMDELSHWQRIWTCSESLEKLEQLTMADVRKVLEYLKPEHHWTVIGRP